MSDKPTAGQAAHAAHYQATVNGHIGTRPVPYDELGTLGENAWEDIGGAAVAAVVNPTAEDYDHAAEILRLRGQLRAIKAIADQHALGDTPRAILAQAVLGQMDADL